MSKLNSIKILISITTAALVFHFLVLSKIISYKIAWGGNLKTDKEMYVFEIISIAINLIFKPIIQINSPILMRSIVVFI